MKKINIALIGKGYWGSKLQSYLNDDSNFLLRKVCDSKTDLNEVWNDKSIVSVVVATPNETHYSIIRDALLNKKHVFSEKPLALTKSECLELKMIANDLKLKLHVEYTYTFSKSLKVVLDLILEDGAIGKLLGVDMCVKHLGRFGGGSVYWLLGSHMLSVLGMFLDLKTQRYNKLDIVKYNGEVETGVITFSPFNGQIFVSLNSPHKEVKITFYGDSGTIVYKPVYAPDSVIMTKYDHDLKWTIGEKLIRDVKLVGVDETNNLRLAIQSFYNVLTGKEESNIENAIVITEILENIQKIGRNIDFCPSP